MTTASANDAVGSEVARYVERLPRGLDSYPHPPYLFASDHDRGWSGAIAWH